MKKQKQIAKENAKCCICKKKDAIGYFGISEPDIKPIPLCKLCKLKKQMELFSWGEKE